MALPSTYPGRGRSWILGQVGISRFGPNSEPRGNNRSFPETCKHASAPVKIGSRDSIFSLVNSTYFFKITNHNQHAFNIKYLANLIKKYWTCFRCQKLADFLVCFPPSVRVQVRQPPSWKICLRIKFLALVFEAVQSRPSTTFPESWHDYWKQYFRSFGRGICLPDSPNWRYRQNYDLNKWRVWIREAFLGRISASPEATDGWH